MKEVRSKDKVGIGKGIEKTLSLADRMKSNTSHLAERQRHNKDSQSTPNEYAQSSAQEGFDQITTEAGHIAVGAVRDGYRLGRALCRNHQVKAEAAGNAASASSESVTPLEQGRTLAKQNAQKRMITAQEKKASPLSISTERPISSDAIGSTSSGASPKQTTGLASKEASPVRSSEVQTDRISAEKAGKPFTRKRGSPKDGKSIRSANRTIKGTDHAKKEMIRSAGKTAAKARQSEHIRRAGQMAASAA